jgi:hypothetical protein
MRSSAAVGEEAGGRKRKRRADCGSVRLSERDGQLLRLVGEQYAVSVNQLAALIGRSYRTGRWLRDRWRRAGWVESRQLTVGGASFIWLTGAGVRVAGSPYRTWRPNAALAAHIEAVTEVRLLLEQRLRLGSWVCERSLAKTLLAGSQPRLHLPDGLLDTGRERIAVEVELTLKSRVRLDALLEQLGQHYDQVWYFAAPSLAPTLRRLAADAPWQNITIHSYPPRVGELLA